MKNVKVRSYAATISIEPSIPLEQVAQEVEAALSVKLEREVSGKFEEFVGYIGWALGGRITLIADPRQPTSHYDLDIYGTSDVEGIAVDLTDFLLELLKTRPCLSCKRMA